MLFEKADRLRTASGKEWGIRGESWWSFCWCWTPINRFWFGDKVEREAVLSALSNSSRWFLLLDLIDLLLIDLVLIEEVLLLLESPDCGTVTLTGLGVGWVPFPDCCGVRVLLRLLFPVTVVLGRTAAWLVAHLFFKQKKNVINIE